MISNRSKCGKSRSIGLHTLNRQYLQARHLYPLLSRLEDVKWMLPIRGKHRKDKFFRYEYLHSKLATCIVLLSSKSKFCRLQDLVAQFLDMDSEILSDKNDIYNNKHTARADHDHTSIVYLMFSPHCKACYIGETTTKYRISTHAKEAAKPSKRAQSCHHKMRKIGFHRFTTLTVGLSRKTDRKSLEAALIDKYSNKLPLMNVDHNSSLHLRHTNTTRSTPRPTKVERAAASLQHSTKTSPSAIAPMIQPTVIPTIVFHSGAAGATSGFVESGKCAVMAAFDNDPDACAIHRAIHPSIPMIRHDLHTDMDKTIAIIKSIVPRGMRSLLHLHFSPPCQGLSSANRHAQPERGMANVIWCFKLFKKLGAKYFTMENVPSMLDHIPDFVKKKFHCEVVDMSVMADLHQSRKRAIITNFKQRYTRSNSKFDMAANSKLNIPSHYQQLNNYGNARSIFEPAFTVVGRQMHFYDTETQQKVKMTTEQAWALQGGTRSSFHRFQSVGLPVTKQLLHIGNMLPRPAAREIFESLCYHHSKSVGNQHRQREMISASHGMSCFTWNRRSFFSLQECLKKSISDGSGDSRTIRVRLQPYDCTKLGLIAGIFKADKIKARLVDGTSIKLTLPALVTLLRQKRVTKIRFRRLRLRAGDESLAARIVENIKRSPKRIHRHCADCTLNDIFIVYRTATDITPKGKEFEYAKIKSAITRYCKGRYGVHPSPRFYFKIQTPHGIKRSVFKSFTRQLLQNIPIPGMVKKHILTSSVFSFTKHRSIGDILCNHTKWGKIWSLSSPWQCNCRHLRTPKAGKAPHSTVFEATYRRLPR